MHNWIGSMWNWFGQFLFTLLFSSVMVCLFGLLCENRKVPLKDMFQKLLGLKMMISLVGFFMHPIGKIMY